MVMIKLKNIIEEGKIGDGFKKVIIKLIGWVIKKNPGLRDELADKGLVSKVIRSREAMEMKGEVGSKMRVDEGISSILSLLSNVWNVVDVSPKISIYGVMAIVLNLMDMFKLGGSDVMGVVELVAAVAVVGGVTKMVTNKVERSID